MPNPWEEFMGSNTSTTNGPIQRVGLVVAALAVLGGVCTSPASAVETSTTQTAVATSVAAYGCDSGAIEMRTTLRGWIDWSNYHYYTYDRVVSCIVWPGTTYETVDHGIAWWLFG